MRKIIIVPSSSHWVSFHALTLGLQENGEAVTKVGSVFKEMVDDGHGHLRRHVSHLQQPQTAVKNKKSVQLSVGEKSPAASNAGRSRLEKLGVQNTIKLQGQLRHTLLERRFVRP